MLTPMKFLGSVFVYLIMVVLLSWGILLAVGGHYWLLAVGFLTYSLLLTKFGCLPPDNSH